MSNISRSTRRILALVAGTVALGVFGGCQGSRTASTYDWRNAGNYTASDSYAQNMSTGSVGLASVQLQRQYQPGQSQQPQTTFATVPNN